MWDVIVLIPDHCLSNYFSSVCMCASFPADFESRMRALIVLVPGHCIFTLSYFAVHLLQLELLISR